MNIFMQLAKSNYSPKDIARFRLQGIGKTILYVFLLTLISLLPALYFLNTAVRDAVSTTKDVISSEFPSFTIENGRLHADMKKPVIIDENGFIFILDATGELDQNDVSGEYDNAIGLLEKEFVFVAGGQMQTYPYSVAEGLKMTKKDLAGFVAAMDESLVFVLPILSLVFYLFTSGMKFIEISILALLGLVMGNASRRQLGYRHVWRMSAYAITLPTLFFTIMEALQTIVPAGFFIHWIVAYIILYLAIKEIPEQN